ncbi:MAG: hypothetical protein HRU15_17810, partial [Planctomycetes bacterium]|nr:hypothetical protein [Planctomycetota bacterium]
MLDKVNEATLCDLPGIGKKRAQQLIDQGIYRAIDLAHIIPHPLPAEKSAWLPGEEQRCVAQVIDIKTAFIPRRGAMITVHCKRRDGQLMQARFFKALYLKKNFHINQWYIFHGRSGKKSPQILQSPSFQHLQDGADIDDFCLEYICHIQGLSAESLQKIIHWCYDNNILFADPLAQLNDNDYSQHLYALHKLGPILDSDEQDHIWNLSRKVIALRECASFMWQLRKLQLERQQLTALPIQWSDTDLERGRSQLPFTLSLYQEQALSEVSAHLQKNSASLQLLQGDVGCGKTAVAFLS